jgi:hypothetical protein
MTVRIGSHTFDDVLFDAERDGRISVTIPGTARDPGRIESSAEDLAAVLAA